MPKHSKHRNGCDCLNEIATFTPNPDNIDNVSEFCTDGYYGAPCAITMIPECDYYATDGEHITTPCVTLRKDCPTGNTWSSYWRGSGVSDQPILQRGDCIVRNGRGSECSICPSVVCWQLSLSAVTLPDYSGGVPYDIINMPIRSSEGECAYKGTASEDCEIFGVPTRCHLFDVILRASNDGFTITFNYFYSSFGSGLPTFQQKTVTFDLDYFDCAGGEFTATLGANTVSGTLTPLSTLCNEGTGVIGGWEGGCTWISQDVSGAYRKHWLTQTSATTARINLLTRNGYQAVWECNNYDCSDPDGNRFLMLWQDPETYGLPLCLCVRPDPVEIAPGDCAPSFCDEGDSTRSWTHNDGYVCETLAIPAGDYIYPRGVDLPLTVGLGTTGDTYGRCNYFWRTFNYTAASSCDQWAPSGTGLIGVLILARQPGSGGDCYPTGANNDRAVEYQFWCFDYELDDWVYQGSQCGSYFCCDPSVAPIEFTGECCCPDIPTVDECGCTGIPTVLTVSDGTNSFDITYSGGTWLVTPGVGTTFAGCTFGSGSGRSIALQCFGGSTWYFAVDDGNGGLPITCAPTGMCSPFALSCSITGCDSNTYTIDITI